MISAADHRAARTVPLKFASDPPDPAYEPFLEKVRREIAEKLGPEDLALGGFRIHTTLDTGLQRAAVEASNDVLFAPDDPSAAVATGVLRRVVKSGTASMLHDLDEEIGRPSAGKTGTTDDFVDAWYVGYTPRLCTSVWVGHPEGRRSLVGVHGLEEPNGETLPMAIWSAYMARATEDDPSLEFPEADLSPFRIVYGGYQTSF